MKIQWKSMPSRGKGKAKKNKARARRVARKEKKATQAKVTEERQQNTRDSNVSVELAESMDTKPLIVGTSNRPNLNVKARAPESRNPMWQKSVKVTAVNKSMKLGLQTRRHNSKIYLKWTRLDAQMRDSGYFHWKTARNVGTRWIGKISLVPIWLRSGKLRSTSWWSILDVLDMSAHRGLHRNFQWWVLQTSKLLQRTTWHCNTTDKKCFTDMWWRTAENESWSRSHFTWSTCANLSWALLHL